MNEVKSKIRMRYDGHGPAGVSGFDLDPPAGTHVTITGEALEWLEQHGFLHWKRSSEFRGEIRMPESLLVFDTEERDVEADLYELAVLYFDPKVERYART